MSKQSAINAVLGMITFYEEQSLDAVMDGEANIMYEDDSKEELKALHEALKSLSVDELMADPDVQKTLREFIKGRLGDCIEVTDYLKDL